MQSCAIDKIRLAEQEAGSLMSRASQEAEEIRNDARIKAEASDQAARRDAEGIMALRLEQADRQAENLKAAARESLHEELAALDAQALKRRAATVEKILRLIGAR